MTCRESLTDDVDTFSKNKNMGDIAQGLQTCSYQERTAQRPVSFSRSRFR